MINYFFRLHLFLKSTFPMWLKLGMPKLTNEKVKESRISSM